LKLNRKLSLIQRASRAGVVVAALSALVVSLPGTAAQASTHFPYGCTFVAPANTNDEFNSFSGGSAPPFASNIFPGYSYCTGSLNGSSAWEMELNPTSGSLNIYNQAGQLLWESGYAGIKTEGFVSTDGEIGLESYYAPYTVQWNPRVSDWVRGDYICFQDDANLVVYSGNAPSCRGNVLWASNT